MKRKEKRISQSFQRWLLLLVIIALLATVEFLWISQTRLSKNSTIDLLTLNIEDVRQDINDASDDNLISLTHLIANVISYLDEVDSDTLI